MAHAIETYFDDEAEAEVRALPCRGRGLGEGRRARLVMPIIAAAASYSARRPAWVAGGAMRP